MSQSYRCSACDHAFESDEARCPNCLKTTTVAAAGAAAPNGVRRRRPGSLGFAGIAVAVLIITPFVVANPGMPIWQTFLVALAGFGAGHLTEFALARRR